MDNKLYADLAAATKYFQIGQEFEERSAIQDEKIYELQSKHEEAMKSKRGLPTVMHIFGIIGSIMFANLLAMALVLGLLESRSLGVFLILFAISVVILVISIGLFVGSHILDKLYEKAEQKRFEKEDLPLIKQAEAENAKIENAVNEFVELNLHIVEFIPISYRTLDATVFMFLAVANGRAETLKEAINLYEEHLHRMRLEDAARAAAEMQQYTLMAFDELNRRQAETNSLLTQIQFTEMLNLLKD